jgi:RNA polymerase sigma-70 factor (ECF subfamily)
MQNVISLGQPQEETGLGSREGSNYPDESETALVEGCKQGKLHAYESLYEAHGERMKSIAYNILGNTSDAEDAVQEAFLKIYRKANQFRGGSAFTTWIYRVLVNACYDSMRKRQRRGTELGVGESGEPVFPVSGAERRDHALRLTLEKSLKQMPERNRTVFLLFEVEGFKHGEIAEILNIPEGTSKNILFEARKALQRKLLESHPARSSHEM